jgi:hypothetical protein
MISIMMLTTLVAMLAGGIWLWTGVALEVLIAILLDNIFGDDIEEPKYRASWLLNFMLFSTLPMLMLLSIAYAWQLSPVDFLSIGALVQKWTGFDILTAKAKTPLIHLIGGGLSLGFYYAAGGTNVGHELTHRVKSLPALIFGRWMLAFTSDASFAVEHVYGHHVNIATPKDPATAKRGENVWPFVVRSTIFSYVSAWKLEKQRLKNKGYSVWSWRNRMHRGNLMTACYATFFGFAAGYAGVLAFFAVSLYGKIYLELINYVEHYGLVRVPGAPVEPKHSWNCNQKISSWVLYNLPRHSHHHAQASTPFWELRSYSEAPMLPYGYMTMIVIAAIPPLWHKLMTRRVLQWDKRYATQDELALAKEANAKSGMAAFSG